MEFYFSVAVEYMYFAVRLVDRTGSIPTTSDADIGNVNVVFAFHTVQRTLFPVPGIYYDSQSILMINATKGLHGWHYLQTHDVPPSQHAGFPLSSNRFDLIDVVPGANNNVSNQYMRWFEQEDMVGMSFAVETDSGSSPFFSINSGSYSAGFDNFEPFANINLTVFDTCQIFFPTLVTTNLTASIEVPTATDNNTVGILPPEVQLLPDQFFSSVYFDSVNKFTVFGVEPSVASYSTMSPEMVRRMYTWISQPLACMLNVRLDRVYVHSLTVGRVASVNYSSIAEKIMIPSSSNNSNNVSDVVRALEANTISVTILVRAETVQEAVEISRFIRNNTINSGNMTELVSQGLVLYIREYQEYLTRINDTSSSKPIVNFLSASSSPQQQQLLPLLLPQSIKVDLLSPPDGVEIWKRVEIPPPPPPTTNTPAPTPGGRPSQGNLATPPSSITTSLLVSLAVVSFITQY